MAVSVGDSLRGPCGWPRGLAGTSGIFTPDTILRWNGKPYKGRYDSTDLASTLAVALEDDHFSIRKRENPWRRNTCDQGGNLPSDLTAMFLCQGLSRLLL